MIPQASNVVKEVLQKLLKDAVPMVVNYPTRYGASESLVKAVPVESIHKLAKKYAVKLDEEQMEREQAADKAPSDVEKATASKILNRIWEVTAGNTLELDNRDFAELVAEYGVELAPLD